MAYHTYMKTFEQIIFTTVSQSFKEILRVLEIQIYYLGTNEKFKILGSQQNKFVSIET